MTTITLYGIPNCDTVKKARTWLAAQQLDFTFHDFKKQGLERATVEAWLQQLPWDVLVNRKGTTWRALSDERKAPIIDAASAIDTDAGKPVHHQAPRTGQGWQVQRGVFRCTVRSHFRAVIFT